MVRSVPYAAVLAAALLAGSLTPAPPVADPPVSLQSDPGHPLWGLLQATGHTPAEWAQLMLQDLDQNRRTDFLDLLSSTAAASGLQETPTELLVYGDAATLSALALQVPGAEPIDAAGALFLTLPLSQLGALDVPGVSLVVWEPRAYVTASTNPSGGNPASLPQNNIHQAGTAWTSTPTAWTGTGVEIAILDTGVDANHQALDGGKVTAWKDCTSNAATAYDNHGHGTHVASIAAGDDGTDFRGMAYQANIVGVKILNGAGDGTIGWFQCGINWIANAAGTPRADIASMSAGLGVPPLGLTTLNGGEFDLFGWDAVAAQLPAWEDIPFTIAAGNHIGTVVEVSGLDETTHVGVNGVNQVSSPAYSQYVAAVGAVDRYQAAATFTGLGPGRLGAIKPDVAAQGVDTWGALAGTTTLYDAWDGTSMATPIAAGVLALEFQKNGGLTYVGYYNALRNGAGAACLSTLIAGCIAEPQDPNFVVGHGVVKAMNSVNLV